MNNCLVSVLRIIVVFVGFLNLCKTKTTLYDKIYYDLNSPSNSMCFRRFNATHQIGCSSDRGGNVGVVYHAPNPDRLQWLIDLGLHQPYIVLLPTDMFSRENFDSLVQSRKVNGIVVMVSNETDRPDAFSPDTNCPNDRYGLYSSDDKYGNCRKVEWNSFGNGMMFDDVPFPIVTISNQTNIDFIINECYEKFNNVTEITLPCAMEIMDIMDGAKDTPTCLRRTNIVNNLSPQGYCDTLGNYNVHSYLESLNKTVELANESVIIIAARLDAFSMFDNRYPGFDSATLGFVTLYAIAEALGKVKEDLSKIVLEKPIMFSLFHGEAFDYIGSSRMVYDIKKGDFKPIFLESIGTFIEIGQIGLNNDDDKNTIWIHTDPISLTKSDVKTRVNNLVNSMTNISETVGLDVRRAPEDNPLPPSSLQQFLKSSKTSIAGIVLTNHDRNFTNRYYNSMYDNTTKNLSSPESYNEVTPVEEHVKKIATTVARTVYSLLGGNSSDLENINASNVTVANLIYCFMKSPNCELLNSTSEHGNSDFVNIINTSPESYLQRYVGVFSSQRYSKLIATHHTHLLAHFLGTIERNATDQKACDELKNKKDGYFYFFLNGTINAENNSTRVPVCVRSTANISDAYSPAFIENNYDYSSNEYSAWTESRWESDAMRIRVFLLPNRNQEIKILFVGIGLVVISFLLAIVVNHRLPTSLFTQIP